MTNTQLQALAANFAEDPAMSRYSGLYQDAVNVGQRQFALESLCYFKDKSWTVVAGTATYALPTDFMFEKLVKFKEIKLDPISRSTLLFYKNRDWTTDSGTPTFYNIDPEEARKTILLYANPGSGDDGGSLTMTYYPFPADLAAASDTPWGSSALLVQFHIAIACYAAWLLKGYDAPTEATAKKRLDLYKQYAEKVAEARDKFGNTTSEQWRFKGGRYWR